MQQENLEEIMTRKKAKKQTVNSSHDKNRKPTYKSDPHIPQNAWYQQQVIKSRFLNLTNILDERAPVIHDSNGCSDY